MDIWAVHSKIDVKDPEPQPNEEKLVAKQVEICGDEVELLFRNKDIPGGTWYLRRKICIPDDVQLTVVHEGEFKEYLYIYSRHKHRWTTYVNVKMQ